MILCLGTTPALARTMRFTRLTVDGVNRAVDVHEYAAGKAVNVARAIRSLRGEAFCIGTRGGATGDRLARLLDETSGAGRHRLIEVAPTTRLCVTAVDESAGTSTELIEESGALQPADGEKLLAALVERLPTAKAVVLSGSLAPGLPVDFYAKCVAACRKADVCSILDASGEPLRQGVMARPTFVKINEAELAGLLGVDGPMDEQGVRDAVGKAAELGSAVIVTRGGRDTFFALTGTIVGRASVPRVKVVSAIGSGDSFAGGFAYGLVDGLPPEGALKLATGCAAANAQTPHAAHFDPAVARMLSREGTVELVGC